MSLQTEFAFTLPRGYLDESGDVHREGTMRLATARDEILPLRDPRVQGNEAYLSVILLSRVVTALGTLPSVNTGTVEGMFATLQFRHERMRAAADSPYAAATDLAELLVARGTPFREAHSIVGSLVRRALEGEASLVDLVTADERLGRDAAALLAPGVSVTRRTTPGGAGPAAVAVQLGRFRGRLAADAERLA